MAGVRYRPLFQFSICSGPDKVGALGATELFWGSIPPWPLLDTLYIPKGLCQLPAHPLQS